MKWKKLNFSGGNCQHSGFPIVNLVAKKDYLFDPPGSVGIDVYISFPDGVHPSVHLPRPQSEQKQSNDRLNRRAWWVTLKSSPFTTFPSTLFLVCVKWKMTKQTTRIIFSHAYPGQSHE